MTHPVFVDSVPPSKANARAYLPVFAPDADTVRATDYQGSWLLYVKTLDSWFERDTSDTTSADNGTSVLVGPNGERWIATTGSSVAVDINAQVDELADRDAFDDEDEGFSVLVSDVGDGRAAIYSKASNASADWTDPAYFTGPQGEQGEPGADSTVPGPAGVSGTSALTRVRVVDTTGLDPSTDYEAGDVIDGVTLVQNDLVLRAAPNGESPDISIDNGVYVVPASGAASRHPDFDTYDDLPGTGFRVMEGSTNADTLWFCNSDRGGTLGTDPIVIEEFAGGTGTFDQDKPFSVWTSQANKSLVERGKYLCHLDDFSGVDKTGENVSTAALHAWMDQARTAGVPAVFSAGRYSIDESLIVPEGVTIIGNGSGFWRANPFGFFVPDLTEDPTISEIMLVGTGPRVHTRDYVTECRQCGYDRPNTNREYNNSLDAEFLLLDLTNRDASGATPATLRQFSAGMLIGGANNASQPVRMSGFRLIPSCPGVGDGTYGTRGYAIQDEVVPFADWDIGMLIENASMSRFTDVVVAGYYKDRGALYMATAKDNPTNGQGEHLHWNGGYIQGGLAVRGPDSWPIIAKAASTLDVRWTASHTFPSSGSLRLNNGDVVTYSGLTYVAGSPNVLQFTGVSDTSSVTVNSTAIMRDTNAGISHTLFEDMYLADQGYASRIEGPNDALGSQATQFRAALEASGDPCRALKLRNVTPMCSGPVAYHIGRAQNMEMEQCYTEPKLYKLTPDGADQAAGALFICGPKSSMTSEVGTDQRPTLQMRGVDMTGSVSMEPLYTATGRHAGVTDIFNPWSFSNERRERGWESASTTSTDLILYGPDEGAVGLYRRDGSGSAIRVLHGFPSGNISIGQTAVHMLVSNVSVRPNTDGGLTLGAASQKWGTIFSTSGTINTSDEDQKQSIEAIPEAWLDAWGDVEFFRFKYDSAVAKKGDGARWHVGLIAQRVHEAFADRGLDAFEIGLLCYDEWPETPPEIHPETGDVLLQGVPAGSSWGVRYEEALVMEAAWMRRELRRLSESRA